jgi:hypothetical protein
MKFREYDPVRTRRDFLEQGITKGEVGTVIIAFTKPNEAYEVEFDDGNGRPKATFPILPDDLEKVLVS